MKNVEQLVGGLLRDYEAYKKLQDLHQYEKPLTVSFLKKNLMKKYDINVHNLYKIYFHIVTVQNKSKYLFTNIEKNPFDFITPEEILIPFTIANNIAESEQIKVSQSVKYKCWIYEYLLETSKSLYVCPNRLSTHMSEYFQSTKKVFTFLNKHLIHYQKKVTLPYYPQFENTLQKRITSLVYSVPYAENEINELINKNTELQLTNTQSVAIEKCITNNLHIVCGYPGTGKSTIIQLLNSYFKYKELTVYFTAPTGLAIKGLLSKLKGYDSNCCGTLHKLIYTVFPYIKDENIIHDTSEEKAKKPDVIIVDEFSMIDILMLKKLIIICLKFDCRLYIFGDSNQLPPVGPGNPLHCICMNEEFKEHITYLTEIKRQSNELLLENIHKVNHGIFVLDENFDNKSMYKIDYESLLCPKTKEVDYNLLTSLINKYDLSMTNTQFLSPENKKNCGTQQINHLLQRYYNKGLFLPKVEFKLNDLVIRIKNKYVSETGMMYANGDMGKIVAIRNEQYFKSFTTFDVDIEYESPYPSIVIKETVSSMELEHEFQLRYCLSIHKSQGSEYDNVVLFIGKPHQSSSWNQGHAKKLLYTAISRTKKRCFVISTNGLLHIAQATEEEEEISNFF